MNRGKHNVLCRRRGRIGSDACGRGSGFAIAIFKASHANKNPERIHSCVLAPSQNSHSPCRLTFTIKNCVTIIFLQVWVRRRYQFIVGRLGCGRVCKIRPVQDCDLRGHFNPLPNYQAKDPTCWLTSRTAVEDNGKIFPFSNWIYLCQRFYMTSDFM